MKITDVKPARVIAALCAVFGAGCITATIIALSSMGVVYGMAPEPGDVLTYLYQINGFFCAFAILLGLCVLLAKRRRAVLAKTAIWAMMILAVMYVTPFVTDTIAYLSAMEFLAAFRYTCAYLPYFMFAAAAVSVLTTWSSPSHTAAGIVSMACSLAAVFASVVYLWQVAPAAASSESTFDAAQIWAIICGFVVVTTGTLLLWFATLSEHVWLRIFYAKTNEEANVVEEADRRERAGREELEEAVRIDLEREAEEKDEEEASGETASENESADDTVSSEAEALSSDEEKTSKDNPDVAEGISTVDPEQDGTGKPESEASSANTVGVGTDAGDQDGRRQTDGE